MSTRITFPVRGMELPGVIGNIDEVSSAGWPHSRSAGKAIWQGSDGRQDRLPYGPRQRQSTSRVSFRSRCCQRNPTMVAVGTRRS